jgi:hypothetical protein
VEGGRDLADREARLEVDVERHRIDLGVLARIEDRGGDLFAVRHRTVFGDGKAGIRVKIDRLHHGLGIIARRHDHRETEGEGAGGLVDGLLVFDLDDDGLARTDIGHLVGEDVGALLLEERCLLALGLGLLIDPLGFETRLDLAFDEAVADLHPQRIDGRILG